MPPPPSPPAALSETDGHATGPLSPNAGTIQALAEHLPVGLYQSTPDGRILFANSALAAVLGIDSVEDLGRLDVRSDLGYPREHFVEEVRRTGAVQSLVVQWTDRAGRTKYTRESARAVCDADGSVRYFEGTMEDVTAEYEARERERHRAEQLGALVRFATAVDGATTAEAVYAAAVEAVVATMRTPLAMLLTRRGDETRCVACSEAIPDDAIALFDALDVGAPLPLHTQPILLRDEWTSDAASLPEAVRAAMRAHGVRSIGSFPLVHRGQAHGAFVVLYDAPHTFGEEELRVAETLAWHIAGSLARQRAESSLRDSETCLRFLAENTAHVLYRLHHQASPGEGAPALGAAPGVFDYLSPAVERLTGYTPDALEALGGFSALIEEQEVIEGDGLLDGDGGEHYLALYRLRTRSGEQVWVEDNAYPWRDASGRAVGRVGMLQDVTERKRREEEEVAEGARVLCQQKALVELGALAGAGPDAVIRRATELAVACTGVARAAVWLCEEDAAGRCRDAFVAAPGAHEGGDVLAPDQFAPWLAEMEAHRSLAIADVEVDGRSAQHGTAGHLRQLGARAALAAPVRRHGRAVGVVSLHAADPRPWNAGEQDFVASVADLIALAYEREERRAAEAARHESEARYRAISELASDYAFAVRLDDEGEGHLAWATDAFARVTGYAAADIRGVPDLLAIVHPESRRDALGAILELRDGGDTARELRIVTKEGEDRWVRHGARCTVSEGTGAVVIYHSGQDVTERKRFERELITAREQAEEVARLKSAFLANMSHEIRTPLTSILGYAALLAEEVEGEQRESVEFIERSGRRLLDTLNSVLDLARLEASGVEPSLEVLDVAAEAHQAIRLLRPLATAKGLALTLEIPATDGTATAVLDRACLGRIFTNLVGNAIKFTDEGRVHVRVEVDEADVLVRVRDTGCGIDAVFLPHLFDEFKQESEGHARSHEGAGLGLAITKRLIDLLGGAIEVESYRPGGTTFTVAFPRHVPRGSGDGATFLTDVPPVPSTLTDESPEVEALEAGSGEAFGGDSAPCGTPTFDDAPSASFAVPYEASEEAGALDSEEASGDTLVLPPYDDHEDISFVGGFYDDLADGYYDGFADGAEAPDPLAAAWSAPALPEPNAGAADAVDSAAAETDEEPVAEAPLPAAPLLSEGEAAAFPPADAPTPVDTPMFTDTPLPNDAPQPAEAAAFDTTPQAAPEPAVPAAMPQDPPVLGFTPIATNREAAASASAAPEADAHGMPSVLVVEDNEDTRALLDRFLQRAYRVCAVPDALSALDWMNRERFDALILDINLGGKQTGIDVLRIARSLPGYEGVFAVALTAYALPGDRERFLEAGFDRYVSKPFTRTTLMAALNEGVPTA